MDNTTSNTTFPLLSLPTELREKIYTHLLVRQRILITYNQTLPSLQTNKTPLPKPKGLVAINGIVSNINTKSTTRFELSSPYLGPTGAAILSTNRQIYQEARYVLYSQNTFDFSTMPAVKVFVSQIGPSNCNLIRSARLSSWNRLGWQLALQELSRLPSLKALEIGVWKYDTYVCQWEVFLRELVHGLGGEEQLGKVKFFAGGGKAWEKGDGIVMGSDEVGRIGGEEVRKALSDKCVLDVAC